MTVEELLVRARSATAHNIIYKLGSGGLSPNANLPANINRECDCSGFVCWCLGMSRQTEHPLYMRFNHGWINTDAMVHDANMQSGFFSRLDQPKPGCIVVFPGNGKGKVGHVGIVTSVEDTEGSTVATRVLHCSSGNYRAHRDAIIETAPDVFRRRDAIYAWFEGIMSE